MTHTADNSFAERIRARYPEGLTGVFAIGGTRTTYLLERNRHQPNPGQIRDFYDYADYMLTRYLEFISLFMELGGQNMVITALSHHRFYHQGNQYAEFIARSTLDLMNDRSVAYYQANGIDPYFVGIDTLLHLPPEHSAHQLGAKLRDFQQAWPYREGRRKVIWEIAAIPLFSFWKAPEVMEAEQQRQLEAALAGNTDLEDVYQTLYRYYARAVYGTDLPMPHFYLGSNRKGSLHLRSLFPIALLCGGPFRLFYTPYPSLFTPKETLRAMLEDMAFGKPVVQLKGSDYSGEYTTELANAEYEYYMSLSADPRSTVGLIRGAATDDEG
ncbi:MAG: hypothetical protein HZC41_00140 [Chloroflexi bacterium]|nr:hypothetical protein [Chloroflexota bacterium]